MGTNSRLYFYFPCNYVQRNLR